MKKSARLTPEGEVIVGVSFSGDLAADLLRGLRREQELRIEGRSEFAFRDGLFRKITDIS